MRYELSLPMRFLIPPYRGPGVPLTALNGSVVPAGAVAAVEASGTPADALLLPETVRSIREAVPVAPVVVRIRELTPLALQLGAGAVRAGARGVLPPGPDENLADLLRPALTHEARLGREVPEWLELRGHPLPPRAAAVVPQILRATRRHHRLRPALHAMKLSPRTAREALAASRLPAPAGWHRLGRALRAALALQREPERSVLHIAWDRGYPDARALRRQLSRVLGVRVPEVRETLGWEWMADRWVRMHLEESV